MLLLLFVLYIGGTVVGDGGVDVVVEWGELDAVAVVVHSSSGCCC